MLADFNVAVYQKDNTNTSGPNGICLRSAEFFNIQKPVIVNHIVDKINEENHIISQQMQKKVFDTIDHPFIKKKNGGGNYFWQKQEQKETFSIQFYFLLHPAAFGNLVPLPGIEPWPPAVKRQCPNHWTTREFLKGIFEKPATNITLPSTFL